MGMSVLLQLGFGVSSGVIQQNPIRLTGNEITVKSYKDHHQTAKTFLCIVTQKTCIKQFHINSPETVK